MVDAPANPLTKRSFFAALLVLVLCLVAANSAVAFLTRHTLPRQSMAMIASSSGASYVLLGNSLLVVGFDGSEFNSQLHVKDPVKDTLNLAMTSTGPLEHLLFLRYALAHGTAPRVLIYGFVDLQLSEPFSLSNRDLIGKREVLYYLEPEYARRFCSFTFRDSLEFEIMRRVAMLAERSAVWGKVELLRRKIAAQGMPPVEENRLGRVADFALLEAADPRAFASRAEGAANLPLNPPVAEILRESANSGARAVFIEMPMSAGHREQYYDTDSWRHYRAHVRALLASQNGLYIDASDWITDDSLFMDHIHLNSAGAILFTRKLARELRQRLPDLMPGDSATFSGNAP